MSNFEEQMRMFEAEVGQGPRHKVTTFFIFVFYDSFIFTFTRSPHPLPFLPDKPWPRKNTQQPLSSPSQQSQEEEVMIMMVDGHIDSSNDVNDR